MIFNREFYSIDFELVAERLLPPFLRTPISLAWIRSILKPLQQLRDSNIDAYYYDGGVDITTGNTAVGLNERLKYNSQTILLEYILNKHFSVVSSPFIYIDNAVSSTDINYVSSVGDGFVPLYVGDSPNDANTVFLGSESDYFPAFDFTVYVPTAVFNTLGSTLAERQARVQAEVNKYKLIGVNNTVTNY
jgi:hypothetical protein